MLERRDLQSASIIAFFWHTIIMRQQPNLVSKLITLPFIHCHDFLTDEATILMCIRNECILNHFKGLFLLYK